MSNATLEQIEMRISPELRAFGKLSERTHDIMDKSENYKTELGKRYLKFAQHQYLLTRVLIHDFESKMLRKLRDGDKSNTRVIAYFDLTYYLKEQLKEKYEEINGGVLK